MSPEVHLLNTNDAPILLMFNGAPVISSRPTHTLSPHAGRSVWVTFWTSGDISGAPSKDTSKEIGTVPNKNPEETIKNTRRSLRIKQKQEKLNKRLIEEEKLNKVIKRIENEHISSFFEDDDSDSNNMDYSSNSTLESHDLPDDQELKLLLQQEHHQHYYKPIF